MIIWPKAKRSVTTDIAMEIANIAKRSGAEPVRPVIIQLEAPVQFQLLE